MLNKKCSLRTLGKATQINGLLKTTIERTDLSKHFRLGASPHATIKNYIPSIPHNDPQSKAPRPPIVKNNKKIYVPERAANNSSFDA